MKLQNLILVTNHFPFGQGESFLEHELPFLAQSFKKVLIISKNTSSDQSRKIPTNVLVERVSTKSSITEDLLTGLRVLLKIKSFLGILRSEFRYLKRREKKGDFATAFHFLIKSFQIKVKIEKLISKYEISKDICLYTYWMNSDALAISFINLKDTILKKITRAHGGDLYEYRQKKNYLPFRELIIQNLDEIFTISENGCEYLKSLSEPSYHHKIKTSYLGTSRPTSIPEKSDLTIIRLVSCSNIIPIKRIHLIIESLALLQNRNFFWTHFGDGPLKNKLVELSTKLLSTKNNIGFEFKGFISNQELIKFYSSTYVDLFINTSQYEGIPVSMMEAQSYGIPIIGTDVGGVSEIVTPLTGFKLDASSSPETIADCVNMMIQKTDTEISTLRKNCRNHWETYYCAEKNFSIFAQQLATLNEITQ